MERRAVAGMDALGREIRMRQAIEMQAHLQDFRAMLDEIADNHEMPRDCWENGWGIDFGDWEIGRIDQFEDEEAEITPG